MSVWVERDNKYFKLLNEKKITPEYLQRLMQSIWKGVQANRASMCSPDKANWSSIKKKEKIYTFVVPALFCA